MTLLDLADIYWVSLQQIIPQQNSDAYDTELTVGVADWHCCYFPIILNVLRKLTNATILAIPGVLSLSQQKINVAFYYQSESEWMTISSQYLNNDKKKKATGILTWSGVGW